MKYYVLPNAAGIEANTNMEGYVVGTGVGHSVSAPKTENNASTVTTVDALYQSNREWAEDQAQKQMDFQTSANKIAMDFSAAEADKARAWEVEMANTAYQRAVKDLKAAGLNPILAYSQGGAAVPSVSSAQGVTSAGARATMTDTGYTSHQLEYAYKSNTVNNAVQVLGSLVSAAALIGSKYLKK